MQDEINDRIVALSIRLGESGAKLTTELLKQAIHQYLAGKEKSRQAARSQEPEGKMTIRELMKKNAELTNIEVTDQNIRSFEKVARKYHIDFALKKDKTGERPRYLVFFKAKDVDVMNAAFREYSARELARGDKPSILKQLLRFQEKTQQRGQTQNREADRQVHRTRERGQER